MSRVGLLLDMGVVHQTEGRRAAQAWAAWGATGARSAQRAGLSHAPSSSSSRAQPARRSNSHTSAPRPRSEALRQFNAILHIIPLLVVGSRKEADEVRELVAIAR